MISYGKIASMNVHFFYLVAFPISTKSGFHFLRQEAFFTGHARLHRLLVHDNGSLNAFCSLSQTSSKLFVFLYLSY